MIILAGASIISLNSSKIIPKSQETVNLQNIQAEKEKFESIRVELLSKSSNSVTIDQYINLLKVRGLIEDIVTTNTDGSKSVTTKTGNIVKIEQIGDKNIKATFEK